MKAILDEEQEVTILGFTCTDYWDPQLGRYAISPAIVYSLPNGDISYDTVLEVISEKPRFKVVKDEQPS